MFAATAAVSNAAAPPQCWQNGVPVACAPGSVPGGSAAPTPNPPTIRSYPPQYYYNPFDEYHGYGCCDTGA
jgi:hypothetical protein